MKKGLSGIFCGFLLLVGSNSIAGKRPIVAVFQIQDKDAGLKKRSLWKLTEYLRTAISEGGAFRVVSQGDIRRALLKKKSETYKECYDQKCQIELGRELAANKSLSTSILKIGRKCVVASQLYDLKTQTTDISAKAKGACSESGLMESLDQVASKIRAWGGGGGFKEEDLGEKPTGDWDVGGGQEVIIRFESEPAGAVVLVDGNLVCQQTPCSKSVKTGNRLVAMQATRYQKRQERKVLTEGGTLSWKLEPNFGWLTVRSEPSGLDVKVNGALVGKTPLSRDEREPGVYKVIVTSPCHYDSGKKIRIERGREKNVSLEIEEKMGAVNVRAMDEKGNDLEADVEIDGKKVGKTPGVYKTSICSKRLVVEHEKFGSAERSLSVREKTVSEVEVTLKSTSFLAKKYWGGGKPRPLLKYDRFRRGREIDIQTSEKRKAIREQLQQLLKYEKDPKERPTLLFRLAENYFEESFAEQRKGQTKIAGIWRNKAIDMYDKIITEYPRYPDRDVIYFFLAGSLWDLQRYKEALKVYRRLIKEYPNSKYIPDAYLGFGEYYFDSAKLDKALMGYKKVAEYKEAEIYPYALYKQGWCYYILHNWKKAKDMFKSVVRIHENEGIIVSDKLNELKKEAQMVLDIMK